MIEFKQKEFWGIAAQMVQTSVQNKKNMAQQEEFQNQQAKLQKKQNEALNNIAKAAEKDPSKAQAAAGVLQQKAYASPTEFLKKGGQVVFDFAKGVGSQNIATKVGKGLALGAAMAAGGYLVDKGIQRDRARITGGAPLPVPQKSPEEQKKARNKKLIKAGVGTALAAGSVLAARKGLLGQGFKNLSHGLTSSGTNKFNTKGLLKTAGKSFKEGMTGKEIGVGALFGGVFTLPGYLRERRQLKEQAAQQQRQYSDETEQPRKNKVGSVLKKAAIGTAATIGTAAVLRRVGPTGIRKSINNMYMTYGKKLAGKSGNGKLGNWMMKSGASEYGKAQAKIAKEALTSRVKSGLEAQATLADRGEKLKLKYKKKFLLFNKKRTASEYKDVLKKQHQLANEKQVAKAQSVLSNFNSADYAKRAGEKKLAAIMSDNEVISRANGRKLGEGLIGGYGNFMGVGKQQATGFLTKMSKSNNEQTAKTADWLLRHRRAGLIGGAAVGSLAWKPFGWGDAAAKKTIGAVDKNAFAYEKSKEQQVPENNE